MDGVIVEINGKRLKVYRNGDIYRQLKNGDYKMIYNTNNQTQGYNQVCCNYIKILRHRIMLYVFKDFDIYNTTLVCDHIDGDRLNNSIDNLRVVTHQENQHNHIHCKGFCFYKPTKKYVASIRINSKSHHLGYYNTRWEARQAYINAIPEYHPSAPHHLYINEEDDKPMSQD